MAYSNVIIEKPTFLASEVGLRTITYTFNSSNSNAETEVVDGVTRKIIKAGTIFPSNDSNAKGIVFEDVDVTKGNAVGSLMVGGVYLAGKLLVAGVETAVSTQALEVFKGQGLFAQAPTTATFPEDGTISA